ncbi:MAG: dienelactone hydrolase family protein [Anaerolineales bacterium]|nr:dienelactone hydrolase family protein [Anaerolineales bacterium]
MEYLAKSGMEARRGAVLVLHAWWGLNEVIRQFCDRLAGEGYLVLAPDLYAGNIAVTIAEAKSLRSKMDRQAIRRQIAAAVDRLTGTPESTGKPIGMIGFSLGSFFAFGLLDKKPEKIAALITYYGLGGSKFTKTTAAFLGHFAEDDDFEPVNAVLEFEQHLQSLGRQATFHLYPGTRHWFCEPDRPEYDPQAAELAWKRTVAFLQEKL